MYLYQNGVEISHLLTKYSLQYDKRAKNCSTTRAKTLKVMTG